MASVMKRLAGPAQLAGAAATIYTATGVTAVIRDIELDNPSGLPITVTFSIGADAAATRVFSGSIVVGAAGHYQWTGNIVMAASDILQAFASTATTVVYTVSGVEIA
jgi:hypothetical protein